MRAKEYLRRIRLLDSMINSDIEHVATLEALATRTTPVLGGERVQTSGNQQKMEDSVIKILEVRDKIATEIDAYVNLKTEARDLIHEYCDPECITLLSKRYLGSYDGSYDRTIYKTWEQIAVEMGLSYAWVKGGLHRRALHQLQVGLNEQKEKFSVNDNT